MNVDVSGQIKNLRVNGVDVVPLVEAELERLWQQTVERARGVAPELLYERVDGEWSFIETLRHLVFASDAWVNRAILDDPSPWHPLDLPHDEMPDEPQRPARSRRAAGAG